jgi:hypothetical protein
MLTATRVSVPASVRRTHADTEYERSVRRSAGRGAVTAPEAPKLNHFLVLAAPELVSPAQAAPPDSVPCCPDTSSRVVVPVRSSSW